MLENLLDQHDSFGGKEEIVKILTLLEDVDSVPVSDLRAINIPSSAINFLQCLGIIKKDKDRISLASRNITQKIPLVIYESLFDKLKEERLLHNFLNEKNLHYDPNSGCVFVKNNQIPLKFSTIRNLLIAFNFFLKDNLISSQFYIQPDFQDWFYKAVVPGIEVSRLTDNPLSRLIKRREHQEAAGKQAELFVLEYEKRQRKSHANAKNIKIISDIDTNAGYDIESYTSDSSLLLDKFIEVKSYTESPSFYWSSNEMETAKIKSSRYYLYLVNRDVMEDKNYHPIQIEDPARNLFSDSEWIYRDDGYFFEKNNA